MKNCWHKMVFIVNYTTVRKGRDKNAKNRI